MMSLRFFAVGALLVGALVACGSSSSSSSSPGSNAAGDADCGPSPCGACQNGFASQDQCVDGDWKCGECLPIQDASIETTTSEDGATLLTCQQKLANPGATGKCSAADENEPCEQGCLTCRCQSGTWGACTTSASCFDAGAD